MITNNLNELSKTKNKDTKFYQIIEKLKKFEAFINKI